MTAQKPAPVKPQFAPLSLMRMLWRGKLLITLVMIGACAIALGVVHSLPAIYQSEAMILVDSQRIPESYVSATVNSDVQNRLMTIRQQILSTTQLLKIIDNLGLYREERKKLVQEEIIEKMQKDVNIKLEKGWTLNRPGAFRVTYQGQDPRVVTEVANQLANLFIEENLRARENEAQGTSDFIDSQLKDAKKTLDDLEANVSKYKVQHNGELPEQETTLSGTLNRLQVELQGNQDALNRAQQNRLLLQSNVSSAEASEAALIRVLEQQPVGIVPAGIASTVSTVSASPKSRLEQLQAQYDALSVRYTPNYPDMQTLQKEIAKQKKQDAQAALDAASLAKTQASKIAEAEKNGRPLPTTSSPQAEQQLLREHERVESAKVQLQLADHEIAARTSDRERILKSISTYQARVEQLPVRQQEMSALTRDYEMAQVHYKSLLDKKLSAGMATDMERRQQAERFTLLDPARVPEKPIKPNRPMLNSLGCLASLGLAIGLAFAKEAKRGAVLGEWELPEGVPVLGRVPFITTKTTEPARRRPPWLRWAMVWSGALLVIAVSAVGTYLYWKRA